MSKKTITICLLVIFCIGMGCSNVGKPAKKRKRTKVNASGDMRR